jgi:hypothetical protein
MSNKLAAKLVDILQTLDSVPKKGFNKHQNYYYMREVDVMESLKKAFIEKKIILLTSSKLAEISPKEKKTSSGDIVTEFITTVETEHTFLDAESGEQLKITSVGSGYDSTDKGAAKAITSAIKYALMKTFMISDEGTDIENDGETKAAPVSAPRTFGKTSVQGVKASPTTQVTVTSSSGDGKPPVTTVQEQPTTPAGVVAINDTSQVKEKFTQPEPPKTLSTPARTFGKKPTLAKAEPSFPQ